MGGRQRGRRTFLAIGLCWAGTVCCWPQSPAPAPRVRRLYAAAEAAQRRGDLPSAAADYEAVLRAAPSLAPAYNNLGGIYLAQHRYARAVATLNEGLRWDPSMASAAALLGIAEFEMGQYAAARGHLEAALRQRPGDEQAEFYLASDLVRLEDYPAAALHLRRLTERQPKNEEAWYLLGTVYMKLSARALARLDAINPNSPWSHEIAGDVMASMKNFDGAVREYQQAVKLAPHQPGTHYKLADAYWQLGEWSAATPEFQAELSKDPYNCMAEWKLGDILLAQHERPAEALTDVDRALALCSSLMQARVDRARALLALGRPRRALPDLLAAAQASPNVSTIHFLLAQAYRETGQQDRARLEMQTFARLEEAARAAAAARAQAATQAAH